MDRELAIDILKAIACCTVRGMTCCDCPLWDNETHRCRPWTDDEASEAVRVLNGERKDNG